MNLMRRNFLKHSVASLAVLPFFTSTRSYAAPMASSKFVDVDGIRTSYFEGGSGEALVLVHGGGFGSTSFANNWRPIFDHLASHFHVYALDKLGQGYTDNPRNDTDYSMEAVIRHVYRFLETLGIEKVHLVGQSRGGLPVARIAADHPELVENLVIFNSRTLAPDDPSLASRTPPTAAQTSPTEPPAPTKESIRQSLLSSRTAYRKDHVTDAYVEAQYRIALLPKRKEAEEKMRLLTSRWLKLNAAKLEENPGLRNRWWYAEVKRETFDRIKAGHLKSPTLIIWGTDDPSAPYSLATNLYKVISSVVDRTRLHFFNRCGHHAFAEYPEEVTRLMVDFIKDS